jgi:hypothetical protein
MDYHRTSSWLGIVRRVDNATCKAGHIRVLGSLVYFYNQINAEWALHRVWTILGLIAIHHVGEGKSTCEPGWYFRLAGMRFERGYHQLSIKWFPADMYNAIKPRWY